MMPRAQTLQTAEPEMSLPADPAGALAVRLIELARHRAGHGLIHVASSERRAELLVRLVEGLAPDLEVIAFPPWDCLPYDRASPSRAVMGRRAAALGRLAQPATSPRLVVTVGDTLIQRVPPRGVWDHGTWTLAVGDAFDAAALEEHLRRTGYGSDERVHKPGEVAFRGEVIDICPGAAEPCRIEHENGCVTAIRSFDPVSQRTTRDLGKVIVGPASEVIYRRDEDCPERSPGMEHQLAAFYPGLETLFDYMPRAALVLEPRAEARVAAISEQILDAHQNRLRLVAPNRASEGAVHHSARPDRLYMDEDEWSRHLASREILRASGNTDSEVGVPRFAADRKPAQAFAAYLSKALVEGRRVVVACAGPSAKTLARRAEGVAGRPPDAAADWSAVLAAAQDALLALPVELDAGFVDASSGTVVIAAPDLLGSRARTVAREDRGAALPGFGDDEFRLGDAVVHLDHGMGVLKGIDTLANDGIGGGEVARLEYAGRAKLLVPVEEFGKVWRYGAEARAVSLDRLDGEAWAKRRAKVEAEIAEAARELVRIARERDAETASKLSPPTQAYERFVARFPFPETPDQARAIEAVLDDLSSGRPMDRLIVGDVGFGKTEVALRAAAAAALSGKQVALAAPTTVLVRQHLATFRRRFAELGIEVAGLSRLVKPAEAKRVKAGLADGSIRIVIGTHALAGKGVAFQDLGLVVIDEEQRFGAAHKPRCATLAAVARRARMCSRSRQRQFPARSSPR